MYVFQDKGELREKSVTCRNIHCHCFLGVSPWGCGDGGGGSKDDSTGRQWTYLVYLGADNSLSTNGLEDIEEMAQVGSSNKVAIVVQAEFDKTFTGSPDTFRGLVEKGTLQTYFDAATNIGEVDMGSPEALTDFITWATTTYPAEHYALVIWDHGDGWKDRSSTVKTSLLRGAVQDTTAGTFMTLPDLGNAVRSAGVPLDIVDFDACLMAMYEVAYEFLGLTDYMVFSEETEPGDGDPYDTILADLVDDPAMTAAELSSVMVNRYDESYAGFGRKTTKSAVDMSQLSAVDTAVLALGQALMADAAANTVAMDARTESKHFYTPANHDLHDFASYIFNNAPDGAAKDAAGALVSAVQAMVISNGTNPDSDASTSVGLAIYMPTTAQTSPWELGEYAVLACNATSRPAASNTWGAYLEWLIGQEGGGTSGVTGGGFTITVRWTTPMAQTVTPTLICGFMNRMIGILNGLIPPCLTRTPTTVRFPRTRIPPGSRWNTSRPTAKSNPVPTISPSTTI